MMKMTEICEKIKKIFNQYLCSQEYARLDRFKVSNSFILAGNNPTDAFDKGRGSIKVLNLFDDFWISFKIQFLEKKYEFDVKKKIDEQYFEENLLSIEDKYYQINTSLSIFQGKKDDKTKTHLFRAEWDNAFESEFKHPQPHWHVYPMIDDIEKPEDYKAYEKEKEKEKMDFSEQIKSDSIAKPINKAKLINISKIHFAMNGHWTKNTDGHIHKIANDELLYTWLKGLLEHIKSQLEYIILKK